MGRGTAEERRADRIRLEGHDRYHRAALDLLYPDEHVDRVRVVLHLARDVETAEALLQGRSVDPSRIDAKGLQWAREAQLVQLVRPIDLLTETA